MTVVTPSRWMEDAVRQSPIFSNKKIVRIPTGIDHNIFVPVGKNYARRLLNLPGNKNIILFGANNPFKTSYKGGDFFIEVLQRLTDSDYLFLVFGSENNNVIKGLANNVRFLGELKEEDELALLYSSADIFICPSTEDNLTRTSSSRRAKPAIGTT